MHVYYQNVTEAYRDITRHLVSGDIEYLVTRSSSRNGEVVKFVDPVMITYTHPKQRVLFDEERDCNPFFHLYEALWMLAGRSDVQALDFYNSNMKNYSDDGEVFNGAYGYRWRKADGFMEPNAIDQLDLLIEHLTKQPDSRRAVLQMWNVVDDLEAIDHSKDVCCNLSVSFHILNNKLDMTVFNRSNDLVWGCLGANAVHFSFLQEYMALSIGVEVGKYNQITSNLHYYTDKWKPYEPKGKLEVYPMDRLPLLSDRKVFDQEVKQFIDAPHLDYKEPFLEKTAKPACLAFAMHKNRKYEEALNYANSIYCEDWRKDCIRWIQKRKRNWESKNETSTH